MRPLISMSSSPSPPQVEHAEDAVWLDMTSSEDEDLNAWCEAGYDLVARGQVAVLLIAGGGGGVRGEGGGE